MRLTRRQRKREPAERTVDGPAGPQVDGESGDGHEMSGAAPAISHSDEVNRLTEPPTDISTAHHPAHTHPSLIDSCWRHRVPSVQRRTMQPYQAAAGDLTIEPLASSPSSPQRRHPLLAAFLLALLLAACMLLSDGGDGDNRTSSTLPPGVSTSLLAERGAERQHADWKHSHSQSHHRHRDGKERKHSDDSQQEPNHRNCSLLPRTRALMHEWMLREAHASLSLLHSLASTLASLLITDEAFSLRQPSDAVSQCQLAREAHELSVVDRHGKQHAVEHSGLFFDEQAASYWTWQRLTLHKHRSKSAARPVWLPGLAAGDCLVCSNKKQCASEEESLAEQRKTMRHAPEGWSIIHTHECQQQQADFRPHKEQRWQNECQAVCQTAYGSDGRVRDPDSLYWLSCQMCHRINAQVDAAADLDVEPLVHTNNISGSQQDYTTDGWSDEDLATVDKVMSQLFSTAQMPDLDQEWATSGFTPSLASERKRRDSAEAVRAFFLDWSGQLAGVTQLVDTALHNPSTLRSLFPDTHAAAPKHSPTPTSSTATFALALQLPFRRPSPSLDRNAQLYAIDVKQVQRTVDEVMGALSRKQQKRAALDLDGGGGSGMGLQLACVPIGSDGIDTAKHAPFIDVGGGGGGGYRSHHFPLDQGDSWFQAGAGGGAGLQSWGVIPASSINQSADGGLTVGGGGGGGLRMRFSSDFHHESKHREGLVVSRSHGASPDDIIALPEINTAGAMGPGLSLDLFPALLAKQMRRCMASPSTSQLVLHSEGGAGGGVKLTMDESEPEDDAVLPRLSASRRRTVRLQHSVNFKLLYEFSTCAWERKAFNCAEPRAFPDEEAREVAVQRADAARTHAAVALQLAEREAARRRGNSTRAASGWSGELQQRLGLCLATSRELSREYMDEQEEEERSTGERPPAVPTAPASQTVSKKAAYHDLLCTCFHAALAEQDPSVDPTTSPIIPRFCKPQTIDKTCTKMDTESTDKHRPSRK